MRRNADLTRQKNVLACLRHRAVNRRHNKDRAVHLRSTRDHVLHIVSMAWAVHVRVVTVLCRILNVRSSQSSGCFVASRRPWLSEAFVEPRRKAIGLRPVPIHGPKKLSCQRCCQSRLAVVNVPDRPNIARAASIDQTSP